MARPQAIFVNRDELLTNIRRLWNDLLSDLEGKLTNAQRDEATAEAARKEHDDAVEARRAAGQWHTTEDSERGQDLARQRRQAYDRVYRLEAQRRELLARGLPYDLHAITGRTNLSPSERLRTNQALRAMEAEGLVVIYGQRATYIWPADGFDALTAKLEAEKQADAELAPGMEAPANG